MSNTITPESISEQVKEILMQATRIEVMDAELYLVDATQMEKLRAFQTISSGLVVTKQHSKAEAGENEKNPFDAIVKLINPNEAAYKYSTYERFTPRTISKPEEVFKALGKEFDVWQKKRKKDIETELKEGNYSQKRADEVRAEINKEIQEGRASLDEVIEHYDQYEVFISTYETARSYPAIYYNMKKKKKENPNLSIKIPNVLWYDPDLVKSEIRGDANVKERINQSTKIGSTIYYKRKEGE